MKMTAELVKYDIEVSALDLGCWPIGGSLKEKRNRAVNTTKIADICEKIEKEAKVSTNCIRKICNDSLKRPDTDYVDSYQRQIWSLPLYAVRRSITGFF